MRKVGAFLLVLLARCSLMLAQTPAPAQDPWHHGTNEYILEGNYARQADGHWRGTVTTAWARFVTDNVEVGTIASFRSVLVRATTPEGPEAVTAQGTGAGSWAEYNVPLKGKKFHIFGHLDGQYLTGDLADVATYAYSTGIGLKWHVGKSSAVRLSFDVDRAGQQNDASAALNQSGIHLGISLGAGKPTT